MTRVLKWFCYANFNVYRSSRRKCVTYLYWNSNGYWLYGLNSFVRTVRDSRIKMLFYADLNTYAAQVDENMVHICNETQQVIDYMCWTCFVSTSSDSRIKMLCCADFNIHRSSRRKCVTYMYLNSQNYRVYVLNVHCKDCSWFAV